MGWGYKTEEKFNALNEVPALAFGIAVAMYLLIFCRVMLFSVFSFWIINSLPEVVGLWTWRWIWHTLLFYLGSFHISLSQKGLSEMRILVGCIFLNGYTFSQTQALIGSKVCYYVVRKICNSFYMTHLFNLSHKS